MLQHVATLLMLGLPNFPDLPLFVLVCSLEALA
jgi:hypothetical protein